MVLNNRDITTLNLAMQILEIRTRFCKYGIMTAEEYRNARTDLEEQPLVYNPETLDEDGMHTIFRGYGVSNKYYEDIYVRYFQGDTKKEDFIEVAVPVVFEDDCVQCEVCAPDICQEIGYYQLYRISRDGTIFEDIDMDESDEECNCCDECYESHCDCGSHKNHHTAGEIMQCRESGAHNLCNCECGEEHCFVECGPDPEAECELNENGRCHCPHNRCCGCDCECDPDEE